MKRELEKLFSREIQYLREILSQLLLEQDLLKNQNYIQHAKAQADRRETKKGMKEVIQKRNQILAAQPIDPYYEKQIELLRKKIVEQRKENSELIKQAKNITQAPQPEPETKKGPSILTKNDNPSVD